MKPQPFFQATTTKNKIPLNWSSKVPKKFKRSLISGELHRSFRISSNFKAEKDRIYKKSRNSGYPSRFINSVMNDFINNNISNDDVIIPK